MGNKKMKKMEELPKSRQIKAGSFVISNYEKRYPSSEYFWVVYETNKKGQFRFSGQGKAGTFGVGEDYWISEYKKDGFTKRYRVVEIPPFKTNDKFVLKYFENLEKKEV